jgi:SAM-dependent methyltransferase
VPTSTATTTVPETAHERFTAVHDCWVCGGARAAPWFNDRYDLACFAEADPELAAYTGRVVRIRRCRDCGFGQPEELPTLPNYFDRKYDLRPPTDWLAREFEATYKDLIIRTVLDGLARRLPANRRTVLDIGCHVGRFLHTARAAGWTGEGVEVNPQTAAFAARRTGMRIHRINVARLADEGRRFDAVTLTDVLEHIPDPVRVLTQIRRLVAPDGWIAVKVPCGPSQLLKQRFRRLIRPGQPLLVATNLGHVNQFDPRSLRIALERSGFVDVRVRPAVPELFELPSRPKRFASHITRQAVYTAAQWLPGGVYSPLALNLQAFGRSPAATGGTANR